MSLASGFSRGQLIKIGDPALADGVGDQFGERRIGQQKPAARRDAVGLIVESLRKHLGKIFHRGRAQQLGMNLCDPVGAVRADDGQIRHAHFFAGTFLDQADALHAAFIARITLAHGIEQPPVDLEDDFELTRHEHLKPRQRPFSSASGSSV